MAHTTRLFTAALTLACTMQLTAQAWTRNITSEQPTFFEVRQAFEDHWAPFEVTAGWYTDDTGVRRKAFGWNPFKRWEYYWETRVGPRGVFPANTVQCDAWQEYSTNRASGGPKGASNWSSLGPFTPEGLPGVGRINCIAFHPTDADIFWVGTPAGGIWKTTDGGNSWATNTDDLPVLGVSWIAVHPNDPDILYVATGDGDLAFALGSAFGQRLRGDTKSIGLLKSENGGSSWTNVLAFDQSEGVLIRKVMLAPGSPDIVYAATSLGMMRSTDAGANWSTVINGHFIDLEFHPADPSTLYASTYDTDGEAQVHVSTDAGLSWDQTTSFTGVARIELAVTPAAPDNVEMVCVDDWVFGMHSMWHSTDAGVSWTQYMDINDGINLLGSSGDASNAGGQGWYDLTLAIDPNDADHFFLGGINLWHTLDGGTTWAISNMWTDDPSSNPPPDVQVVHADKHHAAYHPLLANTLLECNDGGVYKSTNAGQTWTDISAGIVNSQIYSISSAQGGSDGLLAGLQDNGSIGLDQGTWQPYSPGDGMRCHIDPVDPNYRYTSLQNGQLFRTVLDPPSYTRISENISSGQPYGSWLTPFVLVPNDPATIYVGYITVYRSDDRGDSWVQLGAPFLLWMQYLEVAATNSDRLYAGQNSSMKRSIDGGMTWTTISTGLPTPSISISGFMVDPLDEDGVVVTLSGYDADEKVYTSIDAGSTWVNSTGTGLPNLPVNCSVIDPVTGTIYVGTDAGVFVHDAASSSWTPFNTGLPNVVVTDLEVGSGMLRAATFGRGLWETPLLSVGTDEEQASAGFVVVPNPNNGTFSVSLDHALDRVRELWLVNSLGQLVWRDAPAANAHVNSFTVLPGDIPQGVYLLSARTDRGIRTARVVVER